LDAAGIYKSVDDSQTTEHEGPMLASLRVPGHLPNRVILCTE